MDKNKLYSLRDKYIPFDDFEKFREKIKSFFYQNFKFPVIAGHKEFDPKLNWEIKDLSPLENSDKLTIQNFLGGLDKISENNNPLECLFQFEGSILYQGLENLNYKNRGGQILLASTNFAKFGQYFLELTFAGNSKERGYHAIYKRSKIPCIETMEKYLGPNKE